MWGSRLAKSLVVVVVVAGCADDGGGTAGSTVAPVTVADPIDLSAEGQQSASGRVTIPGFDEVEVAVTNEAGDVVESCLLLAAAADQFTQGLMNVVDLGDYAGMLFDFPEGSRDGGFWMRDTPLPLSIAYLDAEGAIVSTADMDPCLDLGDQCPGYLPEGPYRDTVEVPQGGLAAIGLDGPDARLVQTGACSADF
jgi:uncharacterized membrane protein (UPF0127 family)